MASFPVTNIDPLAPPPPRVVGDGTRIPRAMTSMPRPKDVHTKHLTELDRFRVRTLYYDASLSKGRIHQITGYSASQIRTAIRARSAAVGRRPGRPKKGGKPEVVKSGAKKTGRKVITPNGSEASEELMRQARDYFAHIQGAPVDQGGGEEKDYDDDEGSKEEQAREEEVEEEQGGGEEEGMELEDAEMEDPEPEQDKEDSLFDASVNTSALASPTRTSALEPRHAASTRAEEVSAAETPSSSSSSLIPTTTKAARRTGFGDLPAEIRQHIWRSALSVAPGQGPPPWRTWAVAVLPTAPWLELGLTPAHVRLDDNPPWEYYVQSRHAPATVLASVNREARAAVLERCTPILVSPALRSDSASAAATPPFIWIDRFSDVIHFYGEIFRIELFDMAGRSAWPELYK